MTMWMVRAGRGGCLFRNIPDFLDRGLVAIGWYAVGDLTVFRTRAEVFAAVDACWPDSSWGNKRNSAGNLWRFSQEMEAGDYVVTYNPDERWYIVGEAGRYEWQDPVFEPVVTEADVYANMRPVRWVSPKIARDDLTSDTKQELTAHLTVFQLSRQAEQEMELRSE